MGSDKLLGDILIDEGHQVLVATNGKQALEQALLDTPDLVLTDFMMPVMDGAALMEALSAHASLADVPVILMSSSPERSVTTRCQGYVAFLRKPFNVSELIELVSKTCRSGN